MKNDDPFKFTSHRSMIPVSIAHTRNRRSLLRPSSPRKGRRTCIMPKKLSDINSDTDSYRRLLSENYFAHHEHLEKNYTGAAEKPSILNPKFYLHQEANLYEHFVANVEDQQETDQGIDIRLKTQYEQIEEYSDSYILIDIRKAIWRIKVFISDACLTLISSVIFEYFIILVILVNIAVLASEDPNASYSSTAAADDVFLIIYTTEAAIKVCGLGLFLNKTGYLRDHWNKLDLTIVITGWLSNVTTNNVNLSSIRTLRVLRPLRSITSISGLRVLFVALIRSSIPLLASLTVVFCFLLIFGIAGIQLWVGEFRYQCMNLDTGILLGNLCGDSSCSQGSICVNSLKNPNYGVTNFDNIFYALLNVFQCITLEGWTGIMIYGQEVFSIYVVLYFIPLVFIGAFLLLNMTLAVIKNSFTSAMNESLEKGKKKTEPQVIFEKFGKKKPMIEEFSEESPEILVGGENEEGAEADKGHADVERITFNGKTLKNKGIHVQIKANLESHLQFDVENEDSVDEESFLSTPKINHKENLPDPVISTRSVADKYRELSSRNEELTIRKERSLSYFAKTLTIRSSGVWQQNITEEYDRITERISIERRRISEGYKAANKAQFASEISALKFYLIEDFALTLESSEDIRVCKKPDTEPEGTFKGFYYTSAETVSVDRKSTLNREQLFEKYSDLGGYFKIFLKLSVHTNRKRAFAELFPNCKQLIEEVQKKDLMGQQTIGVWSGSDLGVPVDPSLLQHFSQMSYRFSRLNLLISLRLLILRLVETKYFHNSMLLCVVVNTVVLSIDHYGISQSLNSALSNVNIAFTYIFLVEMTLKMIGKGLQKYFRDYMNYFDATVVILSIIEIIFISGSKSTLSAFRAVRVFRVFRVIRVARLFRYLQSMSLIMKVISRSLSKFIYLALLLMLFLIIYSLLGMQVFGGNFNFHGGKPRANFDSFHYSFISIFQVLSIENWQSILFDAMRSSAGPAGAVLLISWIVLGNYVLLNLFLAILLEGFSSKDDAQDFDTVEMRARKPTTTKNTLFGNVEGRLKKQRELKMKMMEDLHSDSEDSYSVTIHDKKKAEKKALVENIVCELSFFVFSKTSRLRVWCYLLSNNKHFDSIVLFVIVLSTIKVVIDTYLMKSPSDSQIVKAMAYIDIIFTILFFLEFIIKSIATGFFEGKTAYIKDNWNQLDFAIILISVLDQSIAGVNLSAIKAIRSLRTLRPLRFISHNVSMKIVVSALFESIAIIANVLIVLLLVWLMFAILGVSLLGGKLYSCDNPILLTRESCETLGFGWTSASPKYDNVLDAIQALFILTSEEGWPDIMNQAVDANDIDIAPSRDANPYIAYYFVVFIFIGSFFFLNFFIGAVFDKFTQAKRNEMSITALMLTKEQMLWVEMQKLLTRVRPVAETKDHKSAIKELCYKVYKSRYFELLIIIVIAVNILQMSMVYREASSQYLSVLENINFGITMFFIFEFLIKITGLGPKAYFENNWNRFDLIVIMCSVADLILSYYLTSSTTLLRLGPQMLRVVRLLRISKLIRIFRALKTLEVLVTIIGYSLPAMLNVLSLMALVFFIYAVLGVNLYYRVTSGKIISNYTNFSNFGMALISLFRISTGEDWYLIMYDCARDNDYTTAALFFMSFVTITSFVMLNFFIMVILQTYDDFESNPFNILKIFTRDLKHIKAVWSKHSMKYGNDRTHFSELIQIMKELPKEFGDFTQLDYEKMLRKFSVMQLEIDAYGFIFYNDFLFAVFKLKYFKRIVGNKEAVNRKIMRNEEVDTLGRLQRLRGALQSKVYTTEQMQVLQKRKKVNFFMEILNAKTIFKTWKNWVRKRRHMKDYDKSLSVTPLDSIIEYPGENSETSHIDLSFEDES